MERSSAGITRGLIEACHAIEPCSTSRTSSAGITRGLIEPGFPIWLWCFCPFDQSSRLDFRGFLERNQATKVAFQGSRITSDAGLILVRELDERLGLAGLIAARLPPRIEHIVPVTRSPAAVGVQPLGGLRRPQRRAASLDRSDVSSDRIADAVGPECGPNLHAPLVGTRPCTRASTHRARWH